MPEKKEMIEGKKRLKVATKYPETAEKYLESLGIQAEIVYLHGSQEIAPTNRPIRSNC